MVMRRVLKHHVCLCVLSTAVLAGLVLLTDQNKVYAGLNCNGVANSSGDGIRSDNNSGRIECDGRSNGKGSGGQLSGKRTIDMSGTWTRGTSNSDGPAVKVHGRGTNITISSELKITDSSKSNTYPAIMVYDRGGLTVNNVNATGVYKGIEVKGSGSSVIVVKGSIGVRTDGGAVIEVSGGGDVTLNRGVTVGTVSASKEVILINNGGNVTVMGTSFTGVQKGIVFKGTEKANVSGGAEGATINLTSGGTGITMQGSGGASATVMSMTIQGKGSTGGYGGRSLF
ncbi:hypothetical protein [Bartonella melophagi]|uniref:Auto-transporter adhesin head GIN domain-containing protein n=1 Tax=Bartonella melophagi K-2C TaxID=1094557 RepID=J1JVB9_9HYPH|nr:hypothetical protein [Bartonella melophagi]EJF88470.1 hypothetical protein ME3_01088 [Bartonella melophagi K-2C]